MDPARRSPALRALVLSLPLLLLLVSARLGAEEPGGTIRVEFRERFVNREFPALVWLESLDGRRWPPSREPVVVDQIELAFVPRVVGVLVGSTVRFLNSDAVIHDVRSRGAREGAFTLGEFRPGQYREVVVREAGVVPVGCRIHSSMRAHLVVVPTPFFGLTDRRRRVELKDVPPGEYRLRFWHERYAPRSVEAVVESGKEIVVVFEGLDPR
jgi:plastocyanin